jgi:hypothetical protein
MLNSRAPNGVIPYLVAVGAVLVMVIVRWLLAPLLGAQLPFTTLVIAVLLLVGTAAWALPSWRPG